VGVVVFVLGKSYEGFVVDKMAKGQISLSVLPFPSLGNISPQLHIHVIWKTDVGDIRKRSYTEKF
jgi:hypothetical protein